MMRVLIAEPNCAGHRLHLVRVLAEGAVKLPVDVQVAVASGARASDEGRVHLTALDGVVEIQESLGGHGGSVQGSRNRAQAVLRVINNSVDHVFIPYADGIAQVLGLRRRLGTLRLPRQVAVEGLLMRGRIAEAGRGVIGKIEQAAWKTAWLTATAAAPFERLHWLDPIQYEAMRRSGSMRLFEKSRLMPEPVEPIRDEGKLEARSAMGIPPSPIYIGVAGPLNTRKGVDRLLHAFQACSFAERDVRLLLCGKPDSVVRPLLEGEYAPSVAAGRIIWRDGYLSDEQFDQALCALDVAALAYPGHLGSSGLLVRAAAIGRTVLASEHGWMGWVTPKFRLGITCDPGDPAGIAAGLKAAVDLAERAPANGGLAEAFTCFHTVQNFQAHFLDLLRERLGLDPDPHLTPWTP